MRGRRRGRRRVDRRPRRIAPGRPRPDRRRGALDRDRGRRPLPRRRRGRAAGRRPGRVPRPGDGGARRAARPVRPDPRPVPDARPGPALGPADRRRRGRAGAAARGRDDPARRVPAGRRRAGVARPGRAADPPPAVARPAAARGRARRSGGARAVPAGLARRRAGRRRRRPSCDRPPRSSASPRSSTSSPACRSRRPSWSGTCCRPGSPATSRGCSTSSGRWARSPGWGGGASAATTAGSRSTGPVARRVRPTGPVDGADRPAGPRHEAIREHLARRGASFYREIFAAAGGGSDRDVLDALWDLVWAGEVTNDTFAPLRALRWKRTGARRAPATGPADVARPPEAAGRWSLVEEAIATPTERLHATALALLDRHGVVTREAVASEGVDGGFSAVYPILRMLEEAGRIRRGYFVDGLGRGPVRAAPGRSSGLRAVREPAGSPRERETLPAGRRRPGEPVRRRVPWPRRGEDDRRPLQRAAGAYVVLVDGAPRCTSSAAAGRSRRCRRPTTRGRRGRAAGAPARSSPTAGSASWSITKVDGGPVGESPFRERLVGGRLRGRVPRPGPPRRPLSRADARGRHALPDRGRPAAAPGRPRRDGRPGDPARDRRSSGSSGDGRRRRVARQEPPDPLRQRPRAADPHADERLVAPLPARRALAPAAGAGPRRPRGSGRGRGLLRRAGRRAVRAASRGASIRASRRSVRTCSTRRSARREAAEALRRLRDPAPGRHVDLGGAARPAGARRDRQHLAQRDAVRRARRPVGAGREPRRRDARTPRSRPPAGCSPTARGSPRAGRAIRVYGRAGRPCPRCGTIIRSAPLPTEVPRTTYWCPKLPGDGGPP